MNEVDLRAGAWLNRPGTFEVERNRLVVTTDANTDFWCHTHYGFTRDTGHYLGFGVPSSFTADIRVQGHFETLYDQAGLMLRAGPKHWVKAGVEFSDGGPRLAAVVTDDLSDWSLSAATIDLSDFWVRMTLIDGALRIQASTDCRAWTLLRLAPFEVRGQPLQVGPMCCTPERAGLIVALSEFRVGPSIDDDLHSV